MKHDRNDFYQHKVGYVHYFGTILTDALKSDNSGNTVSMYVRFDKSVIPYTSIYVVVEWDKNGEFEISVDKYDNYENALEKYLLRAFNVSM